MAETNKINFWLGLFAGMAIVAVIGFAVLLAVVFKGENKVDVPPVTVDNTADTAPAPVAATKSDKPKVELFVMSYCPYGTQIEKGILPVFQLLGKKIDASIKFVYYAMHGEKELTENTLQYCIQSKQPDKYYAYLACFLNSGDSGACVKSTGLDSAKLTACTNSADKQFKITALFNDKTTWLKDQSGQPSFPVYNVNLADNEKYNVGGSPTLIVNGEEISSERDAASLLKVVCSAFKTAPAECSQSLDSATPAPGFGAGTTAGGDAANCAPAGQ